MKRLHIFLLIILLFGSISRQLKAQAPPNNACETVLHFNATNEYVLKPGVITTQTTNVTMEAWFKWNGENGNNHYIMTNGLASGYGIYLTPSGRIDGVLGGLEIIQGTEFAIVGEWTHAALTRNATTWTLYVNGNQTATSATDPSTPLTNFTIGAHGSGSADFFYGSIDEVRVWGTARTEAEIQASMEVQLSGSEANLLAYWDMNERLGSNLYDKTANNNTAGLVSIEPFENWVLADGSPPCVLTPPNGACETVLDFDGGNDHLTAQDNINLRITENFTIEFWFKTESTVQSQRYLIGRSSGGNNQWAVIYEYVQNTIEFFGASGGFTGADPRPGSAIPVPDTNWHHIAYTYGSDTWRGYMDGTLIFSETIDFSLSQLVGADWIIGASDQENANNTEMKMDELRIWDIPRTQNEIKQGMNQQLAGDEVGLKGYWNMNEKLGIMAYDKTANNNSLFLEDMDEFSWTLFDGASVCGVIPSNNSCQTVLDFDGTDEYLAIEDNNGLDISAAITLEAWIYPRASGTKAVIGKWRQAGADQHSYVLYSEGGTGGGFRISQNGSDNLVTLTEWQATPPLESWSHLAATFDGSVAKVYLNGTLIANGAKTGTIFNSSSALWIANEGYNNHFDGMMDEARIWNVARTQTQIQANMELQLIGDEAGLVAYWNMNDKTGGYAKDKTTNLNRAALVGMENGTDWKLSDGSAGCSISAHNTLDFDGSNDYIQIADDDLLDLANDFTLEAWIRPTSNSDMRIIDKTTVGSSDGYTLDINANKLRIIASGLTGGVFAGNTAIPINTWTHVAATFRNGSPNGVKLYINGVLDAQTTASGNAQANAIPLRIGASSEITNLFQGQIDEVRLWLVVRTPAQIQSAMNTELTSAQTGLASYYNFNHGSAGSTNTSVNTSADQSGNCHPGTLNGFALTGASSNWVENTGSLLLPNGYQIHEINLLGNAISIADGDSSPEDADHTAFGIQSVCNGARTRTFTIENKGTETLTISSVNISGTNAADFTVTASPGSPVPGGNSTTLEINFDPSADGVRSAIVTINNNDCDEFVYDFSIQGTGTEISVSLNSKTDAICSNGSNGAASVTVAGGVETLFYDWTPGDPDGDGTSSIINLIPGTWRCTVTDDNNCSDFVDIVIESENTAPTITVSSEPDEMICPGTEVTLTGNGAASYMWTEGVTDGEAFIPSVTKTYIVTGTDASGCTGTDSKTITVNALPVVTAQATEETLCSGEPTTVTGGGASLYSWSDGVTDGIAFSPSATNTYTVTGTDDNGCVNTATKTITVNPLPTVTANASPGSIICAGREITLSGAGAVSYSWTNGVTDGMAFTPAVAESYTVTGTDANGCTGTDNISVALNDCSQTISFDPLSVKNYGDEPFVVTAIASSGLEVTYSSSDTEVATVQGNTITIVGAGSTKITASQAGDESNNAAIPVDQILTVNKGDQVITFEALTEKALGDADFTLTASSSSGLGISYNNSNSSVATISGSTVTLVGFGTTVITASQSGNENYNAAIPVDQTLTVKSGQTITFDAFSPKTFGDADFMLEASASSGFAITYSSSNTAVATVSGVTVKIIGAGTTLITASQTGDSFYVAAEAVQPLVVNKKDQTITFAAIEDKSEGQAPFTFSGSSTSGLDLSFSCSPLSLVNISGDLATILNAGRATITASQNGNNNYRAAAEVTQSFCILPVKPVVTKDISNPESPVLISSAANGNQWYKDGVAIAGATQSDYSITGPGVYTVKVTADDCTSDPSEGVSLIVTNIGTTEAHPVTKLYPNPANDRITAYFQEPGPRAIRLISMEGRQLHYDHTNLQQISIDVSRCKTGHYWLTIETARSAEILRFVKK